MVRASSEKLGYRLSVIGYRGDLVCRRLFQRPYRRRMVSPLPPKKLQGIWRHGSDVPPYLSVASRHHPRTSFSHRRRPSATAWTRQRPARKLPRNWAATVVSSERRGGAECLRIPGDCSAIPRVQSTSTTRCGIKFLSSMTAIRDGLEAPTIGGQEDRALSDTQSLRPSIRPDHADGWASGRVFCLRAGIPIGGRSVGTGKVAARLADQSASPVTSSDWGRRSARGCGGLARQSPSPVTSSDWGRRSARGCVGLAGQSASPVT